MIRAWCLLLCLAPGSWQLSITELVVPESVEKGGSAELRCSYEGAAVFVKWWWAPPTDSQQDNRHQLYQRFVGRAPISMHSNIEAKENDTILISNLMPSDSGFYECEVSNIDEVRKHGELSVYTQGSGPNVTVTLVEDGPDDDAEPDYLIECLADDVAPLPELDITIGGEKMNISESIEVNQSEKGVYSIAGQVSVSASVVAGAEVRCELLYASPFAHPPFVDVLLPPPGEATTAEAPADVTLDDLTPHTEQTLRDYGTTLQCSWTLLAVVTLITKMVAAL